MELIKFLNSSKGSLFLHQKCLNADNRASIFQLLHAWMPIVPMSVMIPRYVQGPEINVVDNGWSIHMNLRVYLLH